jgi:hypothetical protein
LIWLNVILRYRRKAASICFKSITGRDAEAYSDALAVGIAPDAVMLARQLKSQ